MIIKAKTCWLVCRILVAGDRMVASKILYKLLLISMIAPPDLKILREQLRVAREGLVAVLRQGFSYLRHKTETEE